MSQFTMKLSHENALHPAHSPLTPLIPLPPQPAIVGARPPPPTAAAICYHWPRPNTISKPKNAQDWAPCRRLPVAVFPWPSSRRRLLVAAILPVTILLAPIAVLPTLPAAARC